MGGESKIMEGHSSSTGEGGEVSGKIPKSAEWSPLFGFSIPATEMKVAGGHTRKMRKKARIKL